MMVTWWKRCDGQTDGRTDRQTDGLNQSYSCLVAAKNSHEKIRTLGTVEFYGTIAGRRIGSIVGQYHEETKSGIDCFSWALRVAWTNTRLGGEISPYLYHNVAEPDKNRPDASSIVPILARFCYIMVCLQRYRPDHAHSALVLPSHDCATSLANTFVDYFKNKIELIRSNLEESLNTSTDQLPSTTPIFHGLSLEQFRVVSESDVRKVITSSPTKSCVLDPIPTWLLKQCLDQVAPVLTVIVNTSLSCADFTPELKRAFVTPLIKKLILDCENFKNYRPVSNLSFVSKLIERIICVQLVDHLKENGLYEIFQSAYRQLHSTETALLRVQNDILQAVDSDGGAILVLLDLSAAFDTIDHQKLLDLLDCSFGIRGDAL